MKAKNVFGWIAAVGMLGATSAQAVPLPEEVDLQTLIGTLPGGAGIDVVNDRLLFDEGFRLSGAAGQASIFVELAGWSHVNTFGIYDLLDPTNRVEIFDGAASAGASASFSLPSSFGADLFGFYLESPAGLWFSQPLLNGDWSDHLLAFDLGGQYLLAWEDLTASKWDADYNDLVVLVSGVNGVSVPEPTTLGLLGLGLAGMGLFRRRKESVRAQAM